MKSMYVVFVAFVALTCSACGASIQFELIREFPEPVAVTDTVSEDVLAIEEAVDMALETVTFVVDGYSVPVTPAPVTIFGADTEEEAEAMLELADATAFGCQRSALDREAWVCMP